MTVSELIARLQELRDVHGDLTVSLEDGGAQIGAVYYWSDEDDPPHDHGFAIEGVEPSPFKAPAATADSR